MSALIRGGSVICMDPPRTYHEEGFVLVQDGVVTAIGPVEEAPSSSYVNHVEDARGCIVVPGFINLHQHHWYTLLRGLSVGLYLEDWMTAVLSPAAAVLEVEDQLVSMQLAAAEMLSSGTTTFFNHSVTETSADFVHRLAEVSKRTGIRQVYGKEVRATGGAPLSEAEALAAAFPMSAGSMFSVALAIETGEHWITTGAMTSELAHDVARLSSSHNLRVSTHVTGGTVFRSVADFRRRTQLGEVEWLLRHGLLSPRTLLAHAVWIGEDEEAYVAAHGATIVTCPSSSAFTAGGIPPVGRWLAAGINVALGSDGPMVNDSVHLLGLARECFLLQNVRSLTPAVIPIPSLWEMISRSPARALGLDGQLGEIRVGAPADLAIFDLSDPVYGGRLEPETNVILSGSGRPARTVMVGGQVVKDQGGVLTVDVSATLAEARERAIELAGRAGLPTGRAVRPGTT